MKGIQIAPAATRRPATRKRRARYRLDSITTQRHTWLNRAGVATRPAGYATLDVGRTEEVAKRFAEIDAGLTKAA
jgi:hypothetical protein